LEAVGTLIAIVAFVAFVVGAISLVRPIKWARIQNRKQAAIVMGVSFLAFMIGGAFLPTTEDSEAVPASPTTTTETVISASPDTSTSEAAQTEAPSTTLMPAASHSTTTAEEAPTTTAEEVATTTVRASIPHYAIVAEEDISFAGAVRYNLRITVEEGATRQNLRQIATEVSEQYRMSHEYSALNIFFYHYPEVSGDIASLGVWDDSPYGDWGRAGEVEPGNYTHHQPNDKTMEKNWSLLPSQTDATLYAAYNALFYSLAETSDEYPSDDDVIVLVAELEGTSVAAVEDAIDRFLDWLFNDES
jgi:hypothetical protein